MDIFFELLNYFQDRSEGPGVSVLLSRYGRKAVFDTAVELLAWLRRCGDGVVQSVELNERNSLEKVAYDVISGSRDVFAMLDINGRIIDFCSSVTQEERNKIAQFVAAHHRPEHSLRDL